MKNHQPLLWLLVPAALLTMPALYALDIIPSNSHYYYDMGGGSLFSQPSSGTSEGIALGGSADTNLGYTCSAFNPSISMANAMNDIESSPEALAEDILTSATTAIGSFPMYVLEKASPELYNLIQNSMTEAEDTFNLSSKSCQSALGDIRDGKSPYEDWFSVSDSQGWLDYSKSAASGDDVDINTAQKSITQNEGQYGLPWIHDGANSGGTVGDQQPIKVLYDVTVAGYNILVDPMRQSRKLDDVSAPSNSTYLATYWKTPAIAGQWGQLVLGDINISSDDSSSASETHSGVGLVPLMTSCPQVGNYEKTCPAMIADNLWNLVEEREQLTPDNLREVSANQLVISPQVIQALKNQTQEEQTISVNEISQEVALQNLTDEALDFRRVLIAGAGVKQVQNLKPAKDHVKAAIDQLEQDIDDLSYDISKRKELMSNSLIKILDNDSLKTMDSQNQREEMPTASLSHGAVYID